MALNEKDMLIPKVSGGYTEQDPYIASYYPNTEAKPKSKLERVAEVLKGLGRISSGLGAFGDLNTAMQQEKMYQQEDLAKQQMEEAKQARIDRLMEQASGRREQQQYRTEEAEKERQFRTSEAEKERTYKGEQEKGEREFRKQLAQITAGSKSEQKDTSNETSIRNEIKPYTKTMMDVDSSYRKVKSAAENPTAAGDLSLIFGYMKMLDPNSVVREGEFATAQNAASVPDRIRNMYNKIKEGERLNPSQRQDFVSQAQKVYQSQYDSYQSLVQPYTELAGRLGLRMGNIDLYKPISQTLNQKSARLDYDNMSDEELLKHYNAKIGSKMGMK